MKTVIIKENGTETVSYEFTETELGLLRKPLPDAHAQNVKIQVSVADVQNIIFIKRWYSHTRTMAFLILRLH